MRTINEIYTQIILEKENTPILKYKLQEQGLILDNEQVLLEQLSSTSKVSIYRLWAYITAVAIWFHEKLWYQFKDDVQTLIDTEFLGTRRWLVNFVKEYQYDDDIIIEAPYYHPRYEIVDPTKRIIEHSAATEAGGEVFLKIRRKSTDILSEVERDAFDVFLHKIKVAGQIINVINIAADELRLHFKIYYDPIYDISPIKANVYSTIENYIKNLEFNSEINITKLTDEIQKIQGVKAVEYDAGQQSAGKPISTTTWTPITNYYESVAGWSRISDEYPLTDTIEFEGKTL